MRTRFVRTAGFSAAHRYFNPKLSEAENQKIFGELYNADGFGHNFLVEVAFEGDVHPLTGMIVNLADVDLWLKRTLVLIDHKDLNVLPEFEGVAPTPERIVLFVRQRLEAELGAHVVGLRKVGDSRAISLANVRLYEGDDLWIDG